MKRGWGFFFPQPYVESTIGASFMSKLILVDGAPIKFQVGQGGAAGTGRARDGRGCFPIFFLPSFNLFFRVKKILALSTACGLLDLVGECPQVFIRGSQVVLERHGRSP